MKKIINPHTTLLAVGILQPASSQEVRGFLDTVFRESGALPPIGELDQFLAEQVGFGRLVQVNAEGRPLYSLSLMGSHYLSPEHRKTRDKFRFYLLRDAHRGRFFESRGEGEEELAGVSPAPDTSSTVKGRAANKLGRPALGRRRAYGRPYWPRISRQFVKRTGQSRNPRDTFPELLSFQSQEQLRTAAERDKLVWDYLGLGLCLGVSPQLIWNISHQQDKHYRSFEIAKRGGGSRTIESPRIFLKVIQWFLLDFVLVDLDVHDAVHSFAFRRSIATNAQNHVGRKFVGNVDIENFFGSIMKEQVQRYLLDKGFDEIESALIANLCTKGGRLPQGAPTSPVLSNALLFGFDNQMVEFCNQNGLVYTRYADDLTISGEDRAAIAAAIQHIQALLPFGLRLNEAKTRIASSSGQQRVTGVVVNAAAAPPRIYRRNVRALFHKAKTLPAQYRDRIPQMGGAIGFLKIFPKLQESREVTSYEAILRAVRESQAQA